MLSVKLSFTSIEIRLKKHGKSTPYCTSRRNTVMYHTVSVDGRLKVKIWKEKFKLQVSVFRCGTRSLWNYIIWHTLEMMPGRPQCMNCFRRISCHSSGLTSQGSAFADSKVMN
jgi:hypothetical protein